MLQLQTLLGTVLALLISSNANADLAIIGNIQSDIGTLDVQSVKRIFLGERQSFPNGIKAIPMNHSSGSQDRKEFFDTVLGMEESSHKRHWSRMRSTGRGNAPDELSSYAELLQWIVNNPGGITYIDAKHINDSVKVLLTIKDFGNV